MTGTRVWKLTALFVALVAQCRLLRLSYFARVVNVGVWSREKQRRASHARAGDLQYDVLSLVWLRARSADGGVCFLSVCRN